MRKNLILLCDSYPLTAGEFFLDDELYTISPLFENIYILCVSKTTTKVRSTPKNVTLLPYAEPSAFLKFLYIIKGLFFIPLWIELFSLKRFNLSPNIKTLKIMWADFVKASHIKSIIEKNQKNIAFSETIYYSYWHDYKALALAMLRKENGIIAIARCHRWDVYFYAHKTPYLPFKFFIVEYLSKTISISQDGANYLKAQTENKYDHKISVCLLGKRNSRKPLQKKNNTDVFRICSCSTLTPVKRVHLIIDLISTLSKNMPIHWVHFGDGSLNNEIRIVAEQKLKKTDYTFNGLVTNDIILDFYNQNYVDLFINLSESEGIPVSIMEAQSAGIPVLATNVGGTSEIVNIENGFLIEKDFDLADVVKRIEDFFNSSPDEIKSKRVASYNNWKENYNAEKNYIEFANAILNL